MLNLVRILHMDFVTKTSPDCHWIVTDIIYHSYVAKELLEGSVMKIKVYDLPVDVSGHDMAKVLNRPILCKVGDKIYRYHPSGRREDLTVLYAKVSEVVNGASKEDQQGLFSQELPKGKQGK